MPKLVKIGAVLSETALEIWTIHVACIIGTKHEKTMFVTFYTSVFEQKMQILRGLAFIA